MSDFVKKVQVDGENKLIGLDENAIGVGLKLQDEKVALNVAQEAGLAFNYRGELMLMLGSGITTQDGNVQVNIYNESNPSGLAFDPDYRNLCVDLDAKGGMERGVNGLRLALDTNGKFATGLEVQPFNALNDSRYYHLPCVKLKPNGGLALSTEGLALDTARLMEEIKNHFGL